LNSTNSHNPNDEPKLRRTIGKDLRQGDFFRTIQRDFKEIKEFYISSDKKKRLAEMKTLKRTFFLIWWILKSMILKLTPARRILLLIGIILIFSVAKISGTQSDFSTKFDISVIGGIIIFIVLMLELKDKLLALDELEAGRKVQESLMPKECPLFEGWSLWLYTRPANEVCGDLVDFIAINPARAGIVMADVAGKGLNAALLTSKLQATIRAYAEEEDPVKIVSKVNNIFFRDSLRKIFASLLYLQIIPDSGELKFVNAGHLPPVIIKPDGIREMPKGETALGLIKDMKYKLHQIELQSGDVLIGYSDGVTESRNISGNFFGTERFFNILRSISNLSPKEIGQKIISETDKFSGEAPLNDDLSLVIIKRN